MATTNPNGVRLARLRRIMRFAQSRRACPICHEEECDCWEPVAEIIKALEAQTPAEVAALKEAINIVAHGLGA